jgi:hypothetical protein
MAVQILAAALTRADPAHLGSENAPSRLISRRADSAILRQFLPGPVPMDTVVEVIERAPARTLL